MNLTKAIQTVVTVKTIKGTSFVGIREYVNKEGEISNQTFLVGINYENLLRSDLDKLLKFDPLKMKTNFDKQLVLDGYNELVDSLRKRLADEETKAQLLAANDATIKASIAQQDAYIHIAKGLKVQDGNLYIYGLCVRKEVVKPVVYKTVNSKPLTIVKNQIKKEADLRETKYKVFKLGNYETLSIRGIKI